VLSVIQVAERRDDARDDGEEPLVDLLTTYGFMVAGAVIGGLASILFSLIGLMALDDWDYDIPGPWVTVAKAITVALPVVAIVGAALLVGPSSDLVNFIRAVVGVLVGLATSFFAEGVGIPTSRLVFTIELEDGRILTDADAAKYLADPPSTKMRSSSWQKPPGWRPTPLFIARFVLFACIVPPLAGVVVAILIADWK
jgi:hypothetical protein